MEKFNTYNKLRNLGRKTAILNMVVRKVLAENMTFKQRLEGSNRVTENWGICSVWRSGNLSLRR